MVVYRDGVKEGFPQRQLELGNTLQSEKQLEEAAMEHAEEQRKKLKVPICATYYYLFDGFYHKLSPSGLER